LRPTTQTVNVGDVVEIDFYAIRDGSSQYAISAIEGVLDWDPTYLGFLGRLDPCDNPDTCFVCPAEVPPDVPATYNWSTSGFPYDCALDGLNAPCSGLPANDGDAFYTSWPQISGQCECHDGVNNGQPCDQQADCPGGTCEALRAWATVNGLLVTKFRFQLLRAGTTQVGLLEAADCKTYTDGRCELVEDACCNPPTCTSCSFARSRVVGGPYPGGDATGTIGGPVTVNIVSGCDAPTVSAEGCRYLKVTPDPGADPVALFVTGVNPPPTGDPNVSCVAKYVQTDGKLGSAAVYRTPTEWGTVHVRGSEIRSSGSYNVQADCKPSDPGDLLSSTVTAKAWKWGETNGDGTVDFVDITRVVDGFRSVWHNMGRPCTTDAECTTVIPHRKCDTGVGYCLAITIENVDVYGGTGCTPDRVVDFVDITREVDAFMGKVYPCPPCP
jgi:hypothetical protein